MKINLEQAPKTEGSRYPAPFDAPCQGRMRYRLGDAAGLDHFGVNLVTLAPGGWSSQRHWHTAEDEFVFVVSGPIVLVDNAGEHILNTGDCAGFKAGDADGHHLQNRSDHPVQYLEVGTRNPAADIAYYSDIDLIATQGRSGYSHRDGTPYPGAKPRNPATDK